MVFTGLVLLFLALCGIARALFVPLGLLLVVCGVIWDVLHFVAHGVALIF